KKARRHNDGNIPAYLEAIPPIASQQAAQQQPYCLSPLSSPIVTWLGRSSATSPNFVPLPSGSIATICWCSFDPALNTLFPVSSTSSAPGYGGSPVPCNTSVSSVFTDIPPNGVAIFTSL